MGAAEIPTVEQLARERTGSVVTAEDREREAAIAAQREEERRDLLLQVEDIERDPSEIQFIDTTPRRPQAVIYSTLDGEPLLVTRKRARQLLERRFPNGKFRFTGDPAKAPVYRKGNVKCFLHRESAERPVLDQMGLVGHYCPAGQLANDYAKLVHETSKHTRSYDAYQKHLNDEKEREAIKRQDRQYEAMMEMARAITAQQAQQGPQPKRQGTTCRSCGAPIAGKLADHVCEGGT